MDPNASSKIFEPRIKSTMAFPQRNMMILLTFFSQIVLFFTSTSALSVALYLEGDTISSELANKRMHVRMDTEIMTLSQLRSLVALQSYFSDYNMTGHHALIEMSNSLTSNVTSSIATDHREAEFEIKLNENRYYKILDRSECCSFRLNSGERYEIVSEELSVHYKILDRSECCSFRLSSSERHEIVPEEPEYENPLQRSECCRFSYENPLQRSECCRFSFKGGKKT